jgi:hypothetical protein
MLPIGLGRILELETRQVWFHDNSGSLAISRPHNQIGPIVEVAEAIRVYGYQDKTGFRSEVLGLPKERSPQNFRLAPK